jgi:hypothetical protein
MTIRINVNNEFLADTVEEALAIRAALVQRGIWRTGGFGNEPVAPPAYQAPHQVAQEQPPAPEPASRRPSARKRISVDVAGLEFGGLYIKKANRSKGRVIRLLKVVDGLVASEPVATSPLNKTNRVTHTTMTLKTFCSGYRKYTPEDDFAATGEQ